MRGLWPILLVALVAAGGCSDEREPSRPVAATCVVQGRTGPIVSGRWSFVAAACVGRIDQPCVIAAQLDASGAYRITLPAGDYVLESETGYERWFHTADGGVSRSIADAETLRVQPSGSPYTVDFPLGALAVQADVTASLAATRFAFRAVTPDSMTAGYAEWESPVQTGDAPLSAMISALPAGQYLMEVEWSDAYQHHGDTYWLPSSSRRADAALFVVQPYATTEITMTLPTTPAVLAGRVSGAWQTMGLNPPDIWLSDSTGRRVFGPWPVEADGSFSLSMLVPVPVRLEAELDAISSWYGAPGREQAPFIEPQVGTTISGLDIVASGLRLRVSQSELVDWSERIQCSLYRPGASEPTFQFSREIDYEIGVANLPPGDWLLRIAPPGWGYQTWRPQWFDRASSAADAQVLSLPANGEVVTRDLVFEAGGVISGSVTVATDTWPWCTILLTTAKSDETIESHTVARIDGPFTFRRLEDGGYKLGCVAGYPAATGLRSPAETTTYWYPGTTDWAKAAILTIADADTVSGLVFSVP